MPQLPRPCQRFSNGFEPIHLIKSEQLLFKALLDQLPGNHIYYRHNNTGISRISIQKGSNIEVLSLNRLDHLPSDMVS